MVEDLEKEYQKIQEAAERLNSKIEKIGSKIKFFNITSWVLVLSGFLIGVIGVSYYFYNLSDKSVNLSEIDDFIGGTVSTIWSLAGLLFIYVAFLGQQKQMLYQNLELQFSRFERKSTREELKGQKEQMIEQNETIRIQRFETTFFNMLSMLNEITNNLSDVIDVSMPEGVFTDEYKGKVCFQHYYYNILEQFIGEIEVEDQSYFFGKMDRINLHLSNYFNSTFGLFKMIELSNVENKAVYVNIWKSQLTLFEQIVIFYYCLTKMVSKDVILFTQKFNTFENLKDSIWIEQQHYEYYVKK